MDFLINIVKLKAQLDSLRPLKPELEQKLMTSYKVFWNYNSNNPEESPLNFEESRDFTLTGKVSNPKEFHKFYSQRGHNEGIKIIEHAVKDNTPLTEELIKKLHVAVIKEANDYLMSLPINKDKKLKIYAGKYKTIKNLVKTRTGDTFNFALPVETPHRMEELLKWYNEVDKLEKFSKFFLAVNFHYKFLCIHPFDDGNGRTARLLMNYILMKDGFPPVILRKEEKINYLLAIQQSDRGSIYPLIEFLGNNLVKSLELFLKGIVKGAISEQDISEILPIEDVINHALHPVMANKIIYRSTDSLLYLFDFCISPLINKFVNGCQKFFKYYDEIHISHTSDPHSRFVSINDTIIIARRSIDVKREYFNLKFDFKKIKISGIEVHFTAVISFHFGGMSYQVFTGPKEVHFEKQLSENLTDVEINKLVLAEMNRHEIEIKRKIAAKKTY